MKVSICMPTYNKAGYLRRTLESIFVQRPPFEFEVVVADDGSTDDTPQVCGAFPVKYRRLLESGYRNPAPARNVAYREARGDIVVCQSDDVLHAKLDTIERLAVELEPGTFVIATVINVDASGRRYGDVAGKGRGNSLIEYTSPRNKRPLFFLGSLFRRDLYAVGGNDEDFVEPGYDDDWFSQCLMNGRKLRPVFSDTVLGHHQHHPYTQDFDAVDRSRKLFLSKMSLACKKAIPWCASGGAWTLDKEEQ